MGDLTHEVIVVGAGPAGLAVTACLARRGVRALVLEQADAVAASWRRHYHALRLHTSRRQSRLPHLPLPASTSEPPTRADVIRYLDAYARRHARDVRLGVRVDAVAPRDGGWELATSAGRLAARRVVLACGFHGAPVRPPLPGLASFGGPVLHSCEYRDGAPFRGRRVLVVGGGNSGADLAVDLDEHGAEPVLAMRAPVFAVPPRALGLHWRTLFELAPNTLVPVARRLGLGDDARLLAARLWAWIQERHFGELRARGLRLETPAEIVARWARFRAPLTSMRLMDRVRAGRVALRPEVVELVAGGARFAGGAGERFDAIVLATGYRRAPLLDGLPQEDGEVPGKPGLYVCGARPELAPIGAAARRIARRISRDGTRSPARS